jgi:hypothetical protein
LLLLRSRVVVSETLLRPRTHRCPHHDAGTLAIPRSRGGRLRAARTGRGGLLGRLPVSSGCPRAAAESVVIGAGGWLQTLDDIAASASSRSTATQLLCGHGLLDDEFLTVAAVASAQLNQQTVRNLDRCREAAGDSRRPARRHRASGLAAVPLRHRQPRDPLTGWGLDGGERAGGTHRGGYAERRSHAATSLPASSSTPSSRRRRRTSPIPRPLRRPFRARRRPSSRPGGGRRTSRDGR